MSQRPSDPRLREPSENAAIAGELIDTPHNLPGDQPLDDQPPVPSTGAADDETSGDWPPRVEQMIEYANEARDHSYAPYSKFRAGAAVMTDRGSIVTGSIVENVSLGLAMCAERVALFSTIARGERPVGLVLVAPETSGSVTWPCGACLQTALELGGEQFVVSVAPAGDPSPADVQSRGIRELLPQGPRRPDRGPE